jgi:hypothetical protein
VEIAGISRLLSARPLETPTNDFLFSLPLLKLKLNHGDGHRHEHSCFAVSGAALTYQAFLEVLLQKGEFFLSSV